MSSYLFYDLETTGLSKAFDQVLRFAAIRTDELYREIDRTIIHIKLHPDIVISPEAMIVNRISISDATQGTCEYEAMGRIHRLLNEPGTTSIGYNSLGFDDEVLRFSFHRNLLPPYTHQWDKGCHRMDLLPITTAFRLYKPDVIDWPAEENKATLKLEDLSAANQLTEGPAHDAIIDVEAVLELTRRLSKEEEMWNYLIGYFNKETDRLRIENLPVAFGSRSGDHQTGLMVGSGFGHDLAYQVPVITIGDSIPYGNQTLWLRLDLPQLRETTPDTVEENTWVIRKKLGEPDLILPPYERYWQSLGKERRAIARENQQWLETHPEIFQQIIAYHREYAYPVIPDLDPEAALYQLGFLSRKEQELCRKFHSASLEEKVNRIDEFPGPATRQLASRILWRNYPDDLSRKRVKDFKRHMRRANPKSDDDALLDYKGDKRKTPAGALADITRLKKERDLDQEQLSLLDELADYLGRQFTAA